MFHPLKIKSNKFLNELLQLLVFSILVYLSGLLRFTIPGISGAETNLLEIPLLISIFHFRKSWYLVLVSFVAALASHPNDSYLITFLSHLISLSILWYVYAWLKNKTTAYFQHIALWGALVIFYYLVLLLPAFILNSYFIGLNTGKNFGEFYLNLLIFSRFELISAVIITTLYLSQLRLKIALNNHLNEVEAIVHKRTEELSNTIDELKSTQEHLIQSEKMASLGTLTAGVAHEINNPLNFISGGIGIISNLVKELDGGTRPEQKKQFENALNYSNSGLERIKQIVNALKTFSYQGQSHRQLMDLNEVIENTLLFLQYKIPERVEITREYGLSREVPIIAEKIHQVLIHIFENAIAEFHDEPIDSRRLHITTFAQDGLAVIKIFNSGKAIPEADLHRIFDPFFTTREPGQGVGLGLSISYSLIQEHRGRIYAENREDGVCFILELPLE